MKRNLIILLIIGLLLSEITLQVTPRLGFLLYAVLVGGVLISLGLSDTLNQNSKIVIAFIIVPMIRIVELFLTFDIFWRTLIVYIALLFLVAFYAVRFVSKMGFTRDKINWLPVVMIIGLVLGFIGNLIFGLEKHRELLYLLPLIALSEEMLFRGFIQREISNYYSSVGGIFVSSVLYFIFSLSYGLPVAFFFLIISAISAWVYDKTENIWLSISLNLCATALIFVL